MKKITAKTTMEELAAIVSEHLRSQGLQASLVGGAVVSIYSDNEYQSRDLDFISPNEHKREGQFVVAHSMCDGSVSLVLP